MTDRTRKAAGTNELTAEMERRCQGPVCFGHLRYAVAPREELVMLANGQFMRIAAARAFLELAIKARVVAGINLLPSWAFRDHRLQLRLFLAWAQRKNVGFEANIRHVAPAGFSEHHTGYAVDIGDRQGPHRPAARAFQDGPAYAWLVEHAAEFDFENSFPRNNVHGAMFEPWHWRWVGNAHAEKMFGTSRRLVQLDRADPRIGQAVRAGAENGIWDQAAGPVRRTLERLFSDHDAIMDEEQARLATLRGRDDPYSIE